MRELLELQTGQVAFISGLMSGFSLSVAAHVLRYGMRSTMAKLVFLLFLISSLLFLIALYVDVRLSIELVGIAELPQALISDVTFVRNIGTSCATVAFVIFVVATGLLGWLATPFTGFLSTAVGLGILYTLWYIWNNINALSKLLENL